MHIVSRIDFKRCLFRKNIENHTNNSISFLKFWIACQLFFASLLYIACWFFSSMLLPLCVSRLNICVCVPSTHESQFTIDESVYMYSTPEYAAFYYFWWYFTSQNFKIICIIYFRSIRCQCECTRLCVRVCDCDL